MMDWLTVGQRVQRAPAVFDAKDPTEKPGKRPSTAWATVVYVHPKGRFHTVEFASGIRESYPGAAE